MSSKGNERVKGDLITCNTTKRKWEFSGGKEAIISSLWDMLNLKYTCLAPWICSSMILRREVWGTDSRLSPQGAWGRVTGGRTGQTGSTQSLVLEILYAALGNVDFTCQVMGAANEFYTTEKYTDQVFRDDVSGNVEDKLKSGEDRGK